MNRPATLFRRLLAPALVAAALAGCSAVEIKKDAETRAQQVKKGPEAAPFQSITSFSSALRCMDNMMIDYGVRDVSMLVEDILDQTKKVNAGTRDMLISAMSEMTRRSRAFRVIAFGKDSSNMISFLDAAQRQSAYQAIPQFDIKGSVTQWDENVVRTQKDAGIGFQPFVNLGVSGDAAASILGLDLSMLTTEDMSVMPGVTSKNSVVIFKEGKGVDGDAAYKKFGISFSMTFNKSEGQTQALRGLVELAVVELMGKLTRTPYWKCLGADPKAEEIRLEMSDWYYAMATTPGNLIAYFQNQLRVRRFYDGPVDGAFNPAIDEAIANFRAALGMSKEALIEQSLFTTYLDTDVRTIKAPATPARFVETAAADAQAPADAPATPGAAAPGPAAQPVAASPVTPAQPGSTPIANAAPASLPARPGKASADPLRVTVSSVGQRRSFARGELIDLRVQPNRSAHLYCYLQDENMKVARIFPNRWTSSSFVTADRPLELPGNMRFQLVMNGKGVTETIACLATDTDVTQDLPREVFGGDFEPLPVSSLDQIRRTFINVTGGKVAQENFNVQPK